MTSSGADFKILAGNLPESSVRKKNVDVPRGVSLVVYCEFGVKTEDDPYDLEDLSAQK